MWCIAVDLSVPLKSPRQEHRQRFGLRFAEDHYPGRVRSLTQKRTEHVELLLIRAVHRNVGPRMDGGGNTLWSLRRSSSLPVDFENAEDVEPRARSDSTITQGSMIQTKNIQEHAGASEV